MEKAKDLLSPYREEILKCTSCGFCQAACPVFSATLRPAYNTRGKMLLLKEVMEGSIEISRDLAETLLHLHHLPGLHLFLPEEYQGRRACGRSSPEAL